MEALKKFFPLSYRNNDSILNLVIGCVIYVVVAIVAGLLISLAGLLIGWIPVLGPILGWASGIVGWVVEVYVIAGIVIRILSFFKVIK